MLKPLDQIGSAVGRSREGATSRVLGSEGFPHELRTLALERLVRRVVSYESPGYTIVPKGTTVTVYVPHGLAISQELGAAIERRQVSPEQFRVTYHPGDKIPNYALLPPVGCVTVHHVSGVNVVTVSEPTSLSTLLKPGMGAVHWAACAEDPAADWGRNGTMDVVKPSAKPAK